MSKAFEVTLNGETFQAGRPKGGLYREYIRLQDKYGEVNIFGNEEVYDAYMDLAVKAFCNSDITKEKIEAEIFADELQDFILDCIRWLRGIVRDKSEQLPKSKNARMSN